MKKKLEAELISIAHRILKLKNKDEIIQLHQETQKLYEKLTVLRFVEEHFSDAKPTIGQKEIFETVMSSFDDEVVSVSENLEEIEEKAVEIEADVVEEEIVEMEIETPLETENETIAFESENEEAEEILDFQEAQKEAFEEVVEAETESESDLEPNFEMFKDEEVLFEKPKKKKVAKQISFEDLLGEIHEAPVFERIENNETTTESPEILEEIVENPTKPFFELDDEPVEEKEEPAETVEINEVNENFKKGISFGLNDRIAFERHLFGGSSEDLNRVISQLSSFDSFEEAKEFIEDMVKPDYENWEGKEEYELRFMDNIEKKFA